VGDMALLSLCVDAMECGLKVGEQDEEGDCIHCFANAATLIVQPECVMQ